MSKQLRTSEKESRSLFVAPGARFSDAIAPARLRRSDASIPLERAQGSDTPLFRVVIIDNDTNTYEEVIKICMMALPIGYEEAFRIALAVDHNGEAEVFQGSEPEARGVAALIATIGIEVRVFPVG